MAKLSPEPAADSHRPFIGVSTISCRGHRRMVAARSIRHSNIRARGQPGQAGGARPWVCGLKTGALMAYTGFLDCDLFPLLVLSRLH
ncbi:hypothetical protein [Pararhizobium sp. DWP3-4]|uniref:hypothetical protein n=1 Tax=Pararhizobium sp. DWP3-4 TaxID=2804565 RepID=UPI003CEE7D9E